MVSQFSNEDSTYHIETQQQNDHPNPPGRAPQLHVEFVFQVIDRFLNAKPCLGGRSYEQVYLVNDILVKREITNIQFNKLNIINNYIFSYDHLSGAMWSLGVYEPWLHSSIADQIASNCRISCGDHDLHLKVTIVRVRRWFTTPDTFGGSRTGEKNNSSGTEKELVEADKVMEDSQDVICAVCLEEVGTFSSAMKKLPCKHVFHEDCIVTWLNKRHHCPVCRFQMPTTESH